jgi:NADH-quinone oxidoreductase subunit H
MRQFFSVIDNLFSVTVGSGKPLANLLVEILPPLPAFLAEYEQLIAMITACGIFVAIVPLIPLVLVLAERKVSAFIQDRTGPMRVGPWGILQTLADGVKLLFKEDLIPPYGDRVLFRLAPYIIVCFSLAAFVAIPFGGIDLDDEQYVFILSNLNIGIFYIMAVSSVIVIGVIMAGWASNSKWSLLGSLRSAAQMVSYEIPVGLSILAVIMVVQTLNMQGIVDQQGSGLHSWLIFRTPFSFVAFFVFFISAIAEVNRTPFDLPEAESELVAGFHTEYSGMRFALFFIAEYANMFAVSAIAATLFLGGWQGVLPGVDILGGLPGFIFKTLFLVFVMMWVRWTLPRLRVDQLMNLCWKYLIPISFFNILGIGMWMLVFGADTMDMKSLGTSLVIIVLALFILLGQVFKGVSGIKQETIPASST